MNYKFLEIIIYILQKLDVIISKLCYCAKKSLFQIFKNSLKSQNVGFDPTGFSLDLERHSSY